VARLYRENGAFVLSYVTGLLKDRYLAEDVVQETMLRAWRHCGEFRPEKGSVRGWLIRVAHNVAMDTVRMRRSRPAEVAGDAAPQAPAGHGGALTAAPVRGALERLGPSDRGVGGRGDLPGRAHDAGGRAAVLRAELGVTLPAAAAAAAA
jgi:RNA polymerase sigma-70 factor, ECF subfamily